MKRSLITVALGMLFVAVPARAGVDAQTAFEKLKTLAGSWHAELAGEGATEAEAQTASHDFRVASAGTVVMETMHAGTEHEMINMYHLDGEDLLVTHYCASGNQPHMKLDREGSTADKLVFDFTGGTNLDPKVDQHIHGIEIEFVDANRVASAWEGYNDGKSAGVMNFKLVRAE